MTGTVIANRYTIMGKIGSGGTAIVYKAHCAYLQRDVAIKVLRPEFMEDADLVRRFAGEARAAASLVHPNIVQTYDVGKENGVDYIVMELVQGESLKKLLAEHGPMPWRMVADVAEKVASALQRAHGKSIIHRDIKPHNILLTEEGEPKVADFGIARVASASMETMRVDTVASVHYASPEQVRGGYTDARSDIYSLGVTLFELLTGALPYAGENPVSVALSHIHDKIPRVDAINSEIPSRFADIVEMCMQKNRDGRYPDVATLIEDIAQIKDYKESNETASSRYRRPLAKKVAAVGTDKLFAGRSNSGADGNDHAGPNGFYASDLRKEEHDMGDGSGRRRTSSKKQGFNPRKLVYPLLYTVLIGVIIALVVNIIQFVSEDLSAPSAAEERTEFLVSDYRGRDIQEVLEEIRSQAGETLEVEVRYIEANTIAKDRVVRQSPLAGSTIVVGGLTTLELFVSVGVETVLVPEVRGMMKGELLAELRDQYGLVVNQVYEFSQNVEVDRVIRLEPASGTEIARGSEIVMFVSLGKEIRQVSMPDLVGLDRRTAEMRLAENRLALGLINPSGTPQTGVLVISQSITPGNLIPEGSTIDIVFDEAEATPTPTPAPPDGTEPTPPVTPPPDGGGPDQAKTTRELIWDDAWIGDSVQLTVVVHSNVTTLDTVVQDAKIMRADFPYAVLVVNPEGGGTILIYINGSLYMEIQV